MNGKSNFLNNLENETSMKFSKPRRSKTLNCRGQLLVLDRPKVMGILNLTPDSFFDGGRYNSVNAALKHTENMLRDGADIIDLGAYSSRPNADHISEEEELKRLLSPLKEIVKRFSDTVFSIDTFRSRVAQKALEMGAHIINDISGGNLDAELPNIAAQFNAPYICMHMKGNPQTMQDGVGEAEPVETQNMESILAFFAQRVPELVQTGINDVIIDPGFGFGKTVEQNYQMVNRFSEFSIFGKPILAGVSRKSMIRKKYGGSDSETLKGTNEVHRQLLKNGVDILRVHDVKNIFDTINAS